MDKRKIAEISLILVTLGWGISYYLIDISLQEMSPFTLNSYRFILAFLVIGVVSFKRIRFVNRETIKYSFFLGSILFLVYTGATFGVQYTSLTNAGFLCALAVVITPLIQTIILRNPLTRRVQIAAALCFIGIVLMTLTDDFSINKETLPGDLLCIMCSISYACHIILTDWVVKKPSIDSFQIGTFQLIFCGLYCLVMAFIFETPVFPKSGEAIGAVLFLSLFCTGIAFVVQSVAQRHTEASRVGIIFSLEPVFAAVVAFFLAGEVMSPKGYLGGVLMLFALIYMETGLGFLKFNYKDKTENEHSSR